VLLKKLLDEREEVVTTQRLLIKTQADVIELLRTGKDHDQERQQMSDSDMDNFIIKSTPSYEGYFQSK
jgi:hypothetical protein